MKRFVPPAIIVLLLVSMLSFPALAQPASAPAPVPVRTASPRDWEELAPGGDLLPSSINAANAILMDAQTGEVLFEKDADVQRYPASITKIMTCLLALKSGKKLTDRVTASNNIMKLVPSDSSDMGLIAGETMTLGDLLYGLMLASGNEAANVIGNYVGGGLDHFIIMMNDEAQRLGMTNTHFMNAHGYHNKEHYTTARDMAVLAREALKYPEFAKIVSTYRHTTKPTNRHPDGIICTNHNKLLVPNDLYTYGYATGIKTGFHSDAKNTLVASAKKDGQQLISVVLFGSSTKSKSNYFTDSITMLQYGFDFFETLDLKELLTELTIPLEVKNAAVDDPGQGKLELVLKPQGQAYLTDRQDAIDKLRTDPSQFQQELNIIMDTAPILRDQILGTVTFYYEGNPVLACDLLAAREVKEMATPAPTASPVFTDNSARQSENPSSPGATPAAQHTQGDGGFGYTLVTIAVAALLLVLVLLIVRMVNIRRRGRRYSQYNYRGGAKMRR